MPNNPVTTARYYPRLSEIVTVDDLPEFLSFVQNGLNTIFDTIHYKNLQYSKSHRGDAAFYSLDIVSSKKIAIPLPFDMAFVLNPDLTGNDTTISSFPITLEYQWEILAYLKTFSSASFSFSLEDFYSLGLQVFRLSEEQVLAHILNLFVTPATDITKYKQLLNDINALYGYTNANDQIKIPDGVQESVASVAAAITSHTEITKSIPLILFSTYILKSNIDDTKQKLEEFYNVIAPQGIEAHLRRIITPKAKATLALSAAIEFPNSLLKPVYADGSAYTADGITNFKSKFVFAQAQLYADTEAGIGYQLELGGSLKPSNYASIGNSGIVLQIDSLKLDLSKKTNIAEADADGRPNDFVGVYARAISVTLPAKWFHEPAALEANMVSTLRLGGYDLLIGTGGLSGTIMLEAVPTVTANTSTTYYFDNEFDLQFPIVLIQKNATTGAIFETTVATLSALKALLMPTTATIPTYNFKFPLSLAMKPSGEIKTFTSATTYQQFLASLTSETKTLWKSIGSDKGFRIGFNKFDITFKQNKVIASDIQAKLEIKKFVHPDTGEPVHINIEGHLHDDGDFNLTASTDILYPIQLPGVFTYKLKSVELGKEVITNASGATLKEDFYIGTSGSIEFEGILKNVLHLGAIDIDRLRIYSDGSIELVGGSVHLTSPIVLKLGPVEITVTAIHYGSHQREYDGVMRKFNYFGFDGGMSVDPLGVEIRGDGIKFYYCVDDLPNKPDSYLHIQTIYLDLTIPSSTPVAIINGWLSIPEPGISKEYAGGLKLQLPKVKITGSVDMKLAPKYPAFIVDAELEFPAPIPLGPVGIYGFRGLFGYRYVAEKEAVGLVSGVDTWYDYYKFPKRGINVKKFNGPDKSVHSNTPISIGAGASLGTSADNGTILNIKAMVLLSIPSLFMVDGRVAVLCARLGLDDSGEPPFYGFIAIGDDSLELEFGVDFKMPSSSGSILTVQADIQAGFYFKNQKPWYINVGTKTNPVSASIVSLITLKSYLMLSAKGIEGGARGEYNFERNYGGLVVHAWAYLEVGGKISFERPQFGAYMKAGVGAEVDLWGIISVGLSVDILFGIEAPNPFLIYGAFDYNVHIKICWCFSIGFSGHLEVVWDINSTIDKTSINPMISAIDPTKTIAETAKQFVKGINMLSNETFELEYLTFPEPAGFNPTVFYPAVLNKIIPLDTYIDIKTQKGLLPGAISNKIGGYNNPATKYADLVPPDATVAGKPMRQVKHQYSIEKLDILFWNENKWENYHPYEALNPDDTTTAGLKIGQFQKIDDQYSTIRLLATTPFSFTEQGQPGWFIPEQYGINASTLFCAQSLLLPKIADFLSHPLLQHYYCANINYPLLSNEVGFYLNSSYPTDFVTIVDEINPFEFVQSLAFDNYNSLEILLPQDSVKIGLKVSNFSQGVKIKYYASKIVSELPGIGYGNPDPAVSILEENSAYEVLVGIDELHVVQEYNKPSWKPISKIVIEPIFNSAISQQIVALKEQIALINYTNDLISSGEIDGEIVSTTFLENQLHQLICGNGLQANSFINSYPKPDSFNYYYSKEFVENTTSFLFSIGTTEKNGLVSKISSDGNLIWEKTYQLESIPLVFEKVIQLSTVNNTNGVIEFQYILYANSGSSNYLVSINSDNGLVNWVKQVVLDVADVLFLIKESKSDSSFYLSISDSKPTEVNNMPIIGKIDSAGNFLEANRLIVSGMAFKVKSIDTHKKGITVAGNYIGSSLNGLIINMDENMTLLNSLQLISPDTIIQDVKTLKETEYLISGYDKSNDAVFVSKINGYGEQKMYVFSKTGLNETQLQLNNEGFYLLVYNERSGVIHKLNWELNIIWSKSIQFDADTTNTIKNFNFNTETDTITFNTYYPTVGSAVVHTDKNLESCLTQLIENVILEQRFYKVEELILDTDILTLDLKETKFVVNAITSEKFELCPVSSNGCGEENTIICILYNRILYLFDSFFENPNQIDPSNSVLPKTEWTQAILKLLSDFNTLNPSYLLLQHFNTQINSLEHFINVAQTDNEGACYIGDCLCYETVWNAIHYMLTYLNSIGNCNCECNPKNFTLLHEISWLSVEDYQYNINVPSQQAISEDAGAAVSAITNFIQPIWRPDTNYIINFDLQDAVTFNNITTPTIYKYSYGFSTAGPVGFFHKHEKATYGDILLKSGKILEDANGIVRNADGSILDITTENFDSVFELNDPNRPNGISIEAHPDKYALTTLRQYIDYERSYPNADGNLLSAKPLFYDDETTQIYLFFNKAYVKNFFKKWEFYVGTVKKSYDGMLKIVIKDPREDITLLNPPALNSIIETIDIPQTTEVWTADSNPQIPFALSQYANLLNTQHCAGNLTITIPKSEYVLVSPKKLKPNKLYTAIVNNLYDVNHNGEFKDVLSSGANPAIIESREVHKFVFQTSRYRNFSDQVTSYLLNSIIDGVTAQKEAIFTIVTPLETERIIAAFNTIKGLAITTNMSPSLVASPLTSNMLANLKNYQHPFDSIFEGILGLSPLDKPISTEFNIIKNSSQTNEIVAIIIKNPEPFNNPKMPLDKMLDTLQVLVGNTIDSSYHVLFSKDYSQAILMNDANVIPSGTIKFQFKYKIWNGNDYIVPAETLNTPLKYTITVEIAI